MKLDQPLLRLPIRFDTAALARETEALPASAWQPHPNNLPGNDAVPLVSPGGQITNAISGVMAPTAHLLASRYMMEAMAAIGAVWGRSRLMRLQPGAEVARHVDTNYYWRTHIRIHIPVTTTPDVLFTCGGETVHMAAGECWIFDSWRLHDVQNRGSATRVHLVLDTVGGERFWELIDKAGTVESEYVAPGGTGVAKLAFERVNTPEYMTPWEVRSHIAFIAGEAEPDPLLDSVLKRLDKFAFCWAAAWAQHGPSRGGVPDYWRLVGELQRDLEAIGANRLRLRNGMPLVRQMALLIFNYAAPRPEPVPLASAVEG